MAFPTKSLCPGASSNVTRVGSGRVGVTGVTNLACATSTVTPRARSVSAVSSANAHANDDLPSAAASFSFRLSCLASTTPTRWSTRPMSVDLPASTCPSTTTCMSRLAFDACASSSSLGTYSWTGRDGGGFCATAVDEDLPSSRDSDAKPGTVPPVGLTRFAITASSGDGVAKSNPGGGGFPPADARVDGSGRAG